MFAVWSCRRIDLDKDYNMRDLTEDESLLIIRKHIPEEDEFLGFRNHKIHNVLSNTYRFTITLISLEFMISLMEEPQVKNVYFNPSAPPPDGSLDGISLRYKVYVEYFKKEK